MRELLHTQLPETVVLKLHLRYWIVPSDTLSPLATRCPGPGSPVRCLSQVLSDTNTLALPWKCCANKQTLAGILALPTKKLADNHRAALRQQRFFVWSVFPFLFHLCLGS